ncbi:MAG: alanyl-tRNA editing protein [Lachnospiraceae bacterium]|nr:alanyl-tRNA editing protein [Lachnospiraceae bacterium]
MNATIKLYDLDAYQTSFQGTVLSCLPVDDSRFDLILDQTLFFPEEGGQTPDKGTIQSIPVLDVQIKDQIIHHYIEQQIPEGTLVAGEINWAERFSNMQQHSGEHIFSGFVNAAFGYHNVGFHLSQNEVTMDYDGPLTWDDIYELEAKSNQSIYRNLTITAAYPSKEELSKLEYRSKIEINGAVRIVTIPGVDVCACCAPHVHRTGEIGVIKITQLQNYKGGVRLHLLCGKRAMADYRKKQELVLAVSNRLSTSTDTISDAVDKLLGDIQTYKNQIVALQRESIASKAAAIPENTTNCILFEASLDAIPHRELVNLLTAKCSGICGVFVGNDTDGYRYIVGSANIDVREINTTLRTAFNGRGGGSKEMVQGSLTGTAKDLKSLFDGLHV